MNTGTDARGIRNNNPLNLEYRPSIQWKGQTGHDGRYSVFSTPEFGLRAGMRNMRTMFERDNLRTVRAIITRWAPMAENPTDRYIEFVAERANVSPDQALTWRTHVIALAQAMTIFENGYNPYPESVFQTAYAMVDA